jgi:gamma-glutamyl:cysteine ligase YbdK (ATP-grasp superfamily)
MTIGTEHEFSINDRHFSPLPVSDQIIKTICGRNESEILFGDTKLGKELQKTVLELVPRTPADEVSALEAQLVKGIGKFYHIFPDQYTLLGLGMHPTAVPDAIPVWDHDESEYYAAYDRLFNLRQHGWLNIQALQVNLSYRNDRELLSLYNRIRCLLPYLIAVTASSPMVEGRLTGPCDNRLHFYRKNQKEIPLICNNIIPERIRSVADYRAMQEEVYRQLRSRDAAILCEEWVNSGGLIIRFSRKCLEIKALDEQESIRSDMAVVAFLRALLRCRTLPVETDQDALLELTKTAIRSGTAELRPDLEKLYGRALGHATGDEYQYLPIIQDRIRNGSLAQQMAMRVRDEAELIPVLRDMAGCLRHNQSYTSQ